MRRLGPTLCAATLLTLTPAAPAIAGDPTGINVSPASAAPGDEVEMLVSGCDGTTGAAKSEAFVADGSLTGRDGGKSPLAGKAMIRTTVTPGTYEVAVTCDGEDGKVKGSLTVVEQKQKQKQKQKPSPSPSPTAPIRAGGGGTASLAADGQEDEGPGARHAVIGTVLAAAAVLAVTGRILRRRRGNR
ncbi:hypothetical protein [Streptomyces boluensis]|uniref:MYXO-CTERM domain-containing protein n=1 Tax=Streptomyces boluensis TaxID=1775135 RepID=A0A964UMP6_9ACTN|nr:hypothetical protein [Streptomyces boluensis]NBE52068.1 hypothetical protein [Streptomyces boluensis]